MIWVEHITAIAKVEIKTALLTSSAYRPIKWAIAVCQGSYVVITIYNLVEHSKNYKVYDNIVEMNHIITQEILNHLNLNLEL